MSLIKVYNMIKLKEIEKTIISVIQNVSNIIYKASNNK